MEVFYWSEGGDGGGEPDLGRDICDLPHGSDDIVSKKYPEFPREEESAF